MAMSPEGIAFLGSGTVVVVNIAGWIIAENRNKKNAAEAATAAAKTHAVEMTQLNNKVDQVQTDVGDIKKTIGNGGYVGIKQDVQAIKLHCAGEMADLKARVSNIEGGNGHHVVNNGG